MRGLRRYVWCAAVLVGACQQTSTAAVSTAFTLSTPTSDALTIDMSDATATTAGSPLSESTSKDLIAELNTRVSDLVGVVETLVTQAPQSQSTLAVVWVGASGGIVFRFTESRGGPNRFGWLLEAHNDAMTDASYVKILAGGIRRNTDAHRGTGYFALDYDNYAAVAVGTTTTVTARGLFGAVFVHADAGILLAYALKNYTSGPELPHSAFYQAVRITGSTPALSFYRAGGQRDILENTAGDAALDENVIVRARRAEGIGGWARGVVFGGNTPAGTAYLFRECWNETDAVAYRRVWSCDITSDSTLNACHVRTIRALPQIGVLAGAVLPSDGVVSDPNGAVEKETLRRLCFGALGSGLAAAALAEADPPVNADDTTEDVVQAGAPAADTPTSTDSVTAALSADGSPPGI